MTAPTIISAPQGIDITDDSKDLIVSRTIARIKTLGLEIEYISVEDWFTPSSGNVSKTRAWSIFLAAGELQVVESQRMVESGYRYTARCNWTRDVVTTARIIPIQKEVYEALGMKWEDGN